MPTTTTQHSSPLFPLARILSWRAHAVANTTATGTASATSDSSATPNSTSPNSKSLRHIPSLLSSTPRLGSIPESAASSNSRSKSPESNPPSPKPSPRRVLGNLKPELILDCSSGDVPKTHSAIVDAGAQYKQSAIVVHHDSFLCQDAVNTTRLLTLSRKRVMDKICTLGGNTIIDERWSCTVHKHDSKRETRYKVTIMYRGIPARSHLSDPDQPISLHEVKSIPGLMTIVSRHSKYESHTHTL